MPCFLPIQTVTSSLLQVWVSIILLCTAKMIHHLSDCSILPFLQCHYDLFWLLIPLTIRGLNPTGGEIFCSHSERPQGLPTLLYNWNWVSFLAVKWTECGARHLPLLGPQWSILSILSVPAWHVTGQPLPSYITTTSTTINFVKTVATSLNFWHRSFTFNSNKSPT